MKNHIELLREFGFRWGNPDENGEFQQNDGTAMFMQGPDGKIWKTNQLPEIIADIESGALQKRLMAESTESILMNHSPEIAQIVERLRDLVKTIAPDLREEVKSGWGALVYKGNRMVCAIAPHKTHVHLTFYQGTQLTDPDEILTGSGEQLRHIKIYHVDEIQQATIVAFIQEALRIDKV